MRVLTAEMVTQIIDLAPVKTAFDQYIDHYGKGTLADIRFNFYNLLTIPENSYISFPFQPMLNRAILYEVFNTRGILNDVFGRPTYVGISLQIHFYYNEGKPDFPGREVNKIHLQVRHEYILYCVLKLAGLAAEFRDRYIRWKFYLWNRDSNLIDGDVMLREANNGVAGTIVIYGSSDAAEQSRLLTTLLRMFPNHEDMGLMDVRDRATLTVGHVRLNKMISYSGTDRGRLIDRQKANILRFPAEPTVLPPWLRADAVCKEGGLGNEESQLYIGMDVCDATGRPIDYTALCNTAPRTLDQGYCYLPETVMDPRSIGRSGGSRKTRTKKGIKRKHNSRRRR
jgi:hypothetical protein